MFQRISYAVAGGILSVGAPLGLAALRSVRHGTWRRRASSSLAQDGAEYTYVGVSTAIAFTLFGYVLGRHIERLANLSETDSLTGLYNRRGLSRQIATELARWRRYRQPLAVVLVDLDGLKRINDRYGHIAGDAALCQVAAAIRAEQRDGDIGARWGGDEFAILATNTPSQSALALAERLRHVISTAPSPHPLTASFGIAALEGSDDRDEVNSPVLMQAADHALYDAKTRGGNTVAIVRA